ncbi:MAG: alpha-amylase [Candidatus Riflebacteria bacterium]|nr:alpha-amylase [Candidatus Riflebacteria bacterium]
MTGDSVQTPLFRLKAALKASSGGKTTQRYRIPALWAPVGEIARPGDPSREVSPATFFLSHIDAIERNQISGIDPTRSLNSQLKGGNGGEWVTHGSIYNLMVRLSTAYDHDGDGKLGGAAADPTLNSSGIRESGTFLKAIALLGHIRSLGATTIHLLPVTSIGHDGNKGVLGSPYAIKNVYKLEASQADPLIDMSVEDQFRAFIEAAHRLGMRVICEFVFRTASKDADWVKEHPDWFYWIDARIPDRAPGEKDLEKAKKGYGNPIFPQDTLEKVKDKVTRNDFTELPPPPAEYRRFFKLPPASPAQVHMNEKGQYLGTSVDPVFLNNGQLSEPSPNVVSSSAGKQTECKSEKLIETRIPGAFADWPPDDNQPPWGDVTYLRMYIDEDPANPRFNYIGYNTIRMYDTALAQDRFANRPLWNKIRELIPFYQVQYGIDGVMVDMGHAVPVKLMREIVDEGRRHDPDFAFLSENFEINEHSITAGYNAVVGYAWWVEYRREGLRDLLQHIGVRGVPIPFFGATENHNTPRAAERAGGERYSKYAFLVNTFLPNSIPFIHSGSELGETMPVNTGLDFKNEDLERLRGKPLPLFDIAGFDWDRRQDMLSFHRRVLALREELRDAVSAGIHGGFAVVETGHPDVFAFVRKGGGKVALILLNRDLEKAQEGKLDLNAHGGMNLKTISDRLIEGSDARAIPVVNGHVRMTIAPGDCHLFSWTI